RTRRQKRRQMTFLPAKGVSTGQGGRMNLLEVWSSKCWTSPDKWRVQYRAAVRERADGCVVGAGRSTPAREWMSRKERRIVMEPHRCLMVVADDYGIGPETSRAILELAQAGVVTGTV